MPKLKPLGDKILIKPIQKDQEKTESGIIIPDTARDRPQLATVIEVGPGRIAEDGSRIPLEVKVGDKIIFQKFAGTEIKLDKNDDPLLLISEGEILSVILSEKA